MPLLLCDGFDTDFSKLRTICHAAGGVKYTAKTRNGDNKALVREL